MLARHLDQPQTGRQISEQTQVPSPYLTKVLAQLVKANLVSSSRGAGGGYVLAQSPSDIRVLDVVNAIEPIQRILSCPLKNPGQCDKICPLHCELDQAIAGVEQALANRTLADLIKNNKASLNRR